MQTLEVDDALQAGHRDRAGGRPEPARPGPRATSRSASDEGAQLAVGGERLKRETPGFYLAPALFIDTTNDMRINREEIFGPVASVIRVKDYDEALAVANDTPFGLSSGICTTSLKHAAALQAQLPRPAW